MKITIENVYKMILNLTKHIKTTDKLEMQREIRDADMQLDDIIETLNVQMFNNEIKLRNISERLCHIEAFVGVKLKYYRRQYEEAYKRLTTKLLEALAEYERAYNIEYSYKPNWCSKWREKYEKE